jgi:hypothetical protein
LSPEGKPNAYITAITSVFATLANLGPVSVFGFGGKNKENNEPSHCFALNTDTSLQGVEGIIKNYQNGFQKWDLAEPTHLHEVIEAASKAAASETLTQQNQKYFVLLVFTAGNIDDIQETLTSVNTASVQPLSIVIIGVGDHGIKDLEEAHADQSGHEGDIIQMMTFADFKAESGQITDTLHEQLVDFMVAKDIMPNPPDAVSVELP